MTALHTAINWFIYWHISRAFCLREPTQHPRYWITRRTLSDERQREHTGTRGRGKPHRNWPSRDRVSKPAEKDEGGKTKEQSAGSGNVAFQVWEPGEPKVSTWFADCE